MTAAFRFGERAAAAGLLPRVARVTVTLYALLALTGKGHATDRAAIIGLAGFQPADVDPDESDRLVAGIEGGLAVNLPEC